MIESETAQLDCSGEDTGIAASHAKLNSMQTSQSSRFDDASLNRSPEQEVDAEMASVEDLEVPVPSQQFQPLQKVYARDKDGVMYLAVVRRALFGPDYNRQVEIGLVSSKEEADELLNEDDVSPGWHYFVHYTNWKVSFDRWVSEDNVVEITDETKLHAGRIAQEHRALQHQMRRPGTKGKKTWQSLDGAAFLKAWKKRLVQVEQNLRSEGTNRCQENTVEISVNDIQTESTNGEKTNKKKREALSKATIEVERRLREKSLTTKRPQASSSILILPFALKKIMVEQWEMCCQCGMLPSLPAPTTIQSALDLYLKSKNVEKVLSPSYTDCTGDKEEGTCALQQEVNLSDVIVPTSENDAEKKPSSATSLSEASPDEIHNREQEWRDMVNGIATLFNEALPDRLLYQDEVPQLRVIDSSEEFQKKSYSEIYGCEYLLRLFVRLPSMLVDRAKDDMRATFAKVNDFVRFLHKNQGTLFTQNYRKINELEVKEQRKLARNSERKRKSISQLSLAKPV